MSDVQKYAKASMFDDDLVPSEHGDCYLVKDIDPLIETLHDLHDVTIRELRLERKTVKRLLSGEWMHGESS